MKEDMRGLFFIVKGQYQKDNSEDGVCISGYDPYAPTTNEWYMLMDNVTFHCFACGSDLKKVLGGVKRFITKYKTRERYFKHVCEVTSEDYYEVTYLGHRPLTPEQRASKMEGRCPRVSPAMKDLYRKIYDNYGDFFSDLIEKQEDEAYEALKGQTPFKKSKKLVKKTTPLETPVVEEKKTLKKVVKKDTPKEEVVTKKVKPKVTLGLKKHK